MQTTIQKKDQIKYSWMISSANGSASERNLGHFEDCLYFILD
jgi:hypothetical protein